MALEIFKLVGSVFVDTDEANKSLQKTDSTASNVAAGIGKVAGTVAGVATAIVGTATAIGGTMVKMADDVSETADTIDKASIRMGISAESYQELAYAAGQCGVEMATMEVAAKKLEGKDINFDDAIASIMALGTAEERSAKATELFGKNISYKLSPLIEQSGEDFDGLIQRANDLGLVMSGDAVKAGVEFGDLMSDLKQTFESLKNQLGSALIPTLNELLKGFLDNVPTIQAIIQEFVPVISGFMQEFIPQMLEMSQQVMPTFTSLLSQIFPVLMEVISSLFPTALALGQAAMPIFIEIIQTLLPLALQIITALLPVITALLPLFEPLLALLSAILVPLAGLLSDVLPPIIDALTNIITGVMPALIAIINFVSETVSDVINRLIGLMEPSINAIIGMLQGVGDFLTGVFTGDWEKALNGIMAIFKNFINYIILGFQDGMVNACIEAINMIIQAAARLVDAIPGINIDVNKVEIPKLKIPLLAKGGIIAEEGQAIVGENGAELLTLPKGARVDPLNGSAFDYNRLADAIADAIIQTKAFQDIIVYNQIGDQSLQPLVVKAINDANYRSGGR